MFVLSMLAWAFTVKFSNSAPSIAPDGLCAALVNIFPVEEYFCKIVASIPEPTTLTIFGLFGKDKASIKNVPVGINIVPPFTGSESIAA